MLNVFENVFYRSCQLLVLPISSFKSQLKSTKLNYKINLNLTKLKRFMSPL